MDMKEVPPPPPPSGFRRYKKRRSKKMDNKEVPLPPPLPPPPLPHIRSRKKMDIKVVHLPPRRQYPPPPPPLPPPPPYGFRRYHNQSGNELEKRIARLGSSNPRPFQSKRYDNQTLPNPRCPLSNPTYPHTLSPKFSINTTNGCFTCRENTSPWIDHHNVHFFCKRCHVEFHFGCHKYPSELTHPYHLQHPLIFTFHNYHTGIISDASIDESFCATVLSGSIESDVVFDKCTWCRKNIQGNWFYRCSVCKFCLDLSCSQTDPPLLVENPKSHHHSLAFYARPLLTPCDACGSVNVLDPSYACFQCNYMVHQSCIDLPRVIKITRHKHRLFHTPYLHSTIPPCRICYKPVDIKYGQYSCKHEDFSYVVHSKCATHENVWDGKELEDEPEEPENIEDIVPFEKVGSDLIKHFSHEHHLLKLEKYDGVRDAEKQCQACILPINSPHFYNCMECGFFLHEVCAGLPRKLDHALHVHPLVLDPSPQRHFNQNGCLVCSRKSTGFRYKCSTEKCVLLDNVQIDVRCILVPDFFTHKAHEHPLFISTSEKGKSKICCECCKEICLVSYLQCSECKFAMCYRCATIPNEVYYKYDKHSLSLCYGEGVKYGMYWCEVCEKEVDPRDWFYACNKCCITVHLQCVFGSSGYVKPGFTLYHYFTKMEVFRNSKSTRPFCTECGQRCPSSIYYKLGWLGTRTFCSLNCLTSKEKLLVLST
ncbi:DC1 [Arabidopsis thaliana x Arabidopsis arenosa]|uniref:DC1 n=1 Tax=Arabidopsis thaliana x Arabidopsis arenosa TaxID=1240361 RepID=A0A8T2ARR8_9BRAS|nr:DC1 [Arabidopsis thaliana x Arabidopsis arenosa]